MRRRTRLALVLALSGLLGGCGAAADTRPSEGPGRPFWQAEFGGDASRAYHVYAG
ncbi:hypothetical protein [Streptomyces sp. NPDC003877]